MITAISTGFATAFSLILAIGAQNAFVLRQGLIRKHVFALCLFCALSDAILISAGVVGFDAIVKSHPSLPAYATWAGAIFLIVYGFLRFRAALQGESPFESEERASGLLATLTVAAGLTWLNPHVYLDTLALIGAVSTNFHGALKVAFGIGAIAASFGFFFSLGYGARFLAPVMSSPRAWKILDALIGAIMWILAAGLIRSV